MSINRTNRDIPCRYNEEIIEWDISSANTSLLKYYNLLDDDTIDKLNALPKDKRNERVGLMCRDDKELSRNLELAFTNIIKQFIEDNNLDTYTDIVSIKKDAIFVRNRKIVKNNYDGVVIFTPKNTYSGFLLLPRFEFYINGDTIDVKGIKDESLHLHQEGTLYFIREIFRNLPNRQNLYKFIKEYSEAYKKRLLPYDCYREFNSTSMFKVVQEDISSNFSEIDDDILEMIDIGFNYRHVYLETLSIVL